MRCSRPLAALAAAAMMLASPLIGLTEETVKIRQISAPLLEQLTRDWLSLQHKLAGALASSRPELLAQLVTLSKERAFDLRAFMQADPSVILRVALPQSAYDNAPAQTQRYLEHAVSLEGTLENDPEHPAGSLATATGLRLRDRQGRILALHCVGKTPNAVAGAFASIRGIEFEQALVFRSEDFRTQSRSRLDTQAPSLSVAEPLQGSTVKETVTLHPTASDNNGVSQVQLLCDGALIASDRSAPFELAWNTRQSADGPHTLLVRAQDADFNQTQTNPITVTVDNTPPRARILSLSPKQSASDTMHVEIEAADAIGLDSVKLLIDGTAIGVVLGPPFMIPWDTTKGSNGLRSAEALAVDRAGNSTRSEPIEVRVLNANASPILEPIGSKSVQESVGLVFRVSAHDPDGARDPLTFRATHLPAWATFDASVQEFRGTPDFSIASAQEPAKVFADVKIEVCDAQPLCDSESFSITVMNLDRLPSMEPLANRTVREGESLTLTPIFHDADVGTLPCKVTRAPPWMHIDPATCTLEGTPGFEVASPSKSTVTYPDILFEACDGQEQCASAHMTIEVHNVNRKPSLGFIGDKQIQEGRELRFEVRAADPDGETVTLTPLGFPEGMSVREQRQGAWEVDWEPGINESGLYAVVFTASDGELEETEEITIEVKESVLSISGYVLNDVKRPIAGATIEFYRPGQRTYTTVSNAKGQYVMSGLTSGTYTVRCKLNLSPGSPTNLIISFSPISQRIELTTTDLRSVNFMGTPND